MDAGSGAVRLPRPVFKETLSGLARAGRDGLESLAYWPGIRAGPGYRVRRVLFADRFDGFRSGAAFAALPLTSAFEIGREVHERGEILLAQIHTHRREAFHSAADDEHPISCRPGFLSVVVPRFGRGISSVSECRVYEYAGAGVWNELGRRAARGRLRVE